MFFYHGVDVHSASIGGRLASVHCDKCGCGYFYELTRVGSGKATAHYGLGKESAAADSTERAKKDLRRRLEDEAELVPCPRCLWINEGLISGYRRGRMRGWGKIAFCIGGIGTLGSLIGAHFISIGPAADRAALPYFLIGGPSVCLSAAALLLLLRWWLRQRIRPNRDHPLAPSVPVGSPPALVQNAATGLLDVATPPDARDGEVKEWTDHQVGRDLLPSCCSECLLPAAPASSYLRPIAQAVHLAIPFCVPCARLWKRRKRIVTAISFGMILVVGLILELLFPRRLEQFEFWFLQIAFVFVAFCVSLVLG